MKFLFMGLACAAALGFAAPVAEAKGHHGRHGHHHHMHHGHGDRHHRVGIALHCKANSTICRQYRD